VRYASVLWVLTSLLALPARAADTGTTALAVLDLEARGATPVQAHAMTLAIVRGLRQLDVFPVLSAEDVRQLLAIERTRQLLGQEGDDTLGPLRDALGARYVVAGTVAHVAGGLQVEMRLLDTASGKVLNQKSAGPAAVPMLARDLPGLAQELAGPLLEGARGSLLVRVSEEAAEVRVDDVLRGSSPMQEPLALSRGAHRLEVRKDGFIAQLRPVRIEPEQLAVEEVRLLPSPDYAQAWQARHKRARVGAWVLSGVAAGALASAFVLDRHVDRRYQEEFLPRRAALLGEGGDAFAGTSRVTYQQCLEQQRAVCSAEFTGLTQQLGRDQGITVGLLGAGVAAGGVATYLWLTGEDPGRYSRVVAGPTAGRRGTGFALSGRF
jgi:TolB-like protein